MSEKDNKLNSAPVLPFEYPYVEGESIWPCHDCLPWHLDVYLHPEDGSTMVREWHAIGCEIWDRTADG